MKFTQVEPFEKHLLASFQQRPARVHALLVPCPFEREFMACGLIHLFERTYPDLEVKRSNDRALSLFSSHLLYLLENPKAADIPTEGFVVITGTTEGKWEADVVVLDLTKEKSWEREKRLKRYLLVVAKKLGRSITPEALDALMGCSNFGVMLREIEKLSCYAEEEITLSDVQELTPLESSGREGWKEVEAFVQGRGELPLHDAADFFPLVGQVRYLFQKEGNQRGLSELFDIEYLARTTPLSEQLLWNLFTFRYQHAPYSSSKSNQ